MTEPLEPIWLGQKIIGQRPIPKEAVEAFLSWHKGDMPHVAMAKIVTDCMMEIIAPLVDSDDRNIINFRTGLSRGFFERVADGVRKAMRVPITGEEIKDRVFSGLEEISPTAHEPLVASSFGLQGPQL